MTYAKLAVLCDMEYLFRMIQNSVKLGYEKERILRSVEKWAKQATFGNTVNQKAIEAKAGQWLEYLTEVKNNDQF